MITVRDLIGEDLGSTVSQRSGRDIGDQHHSAAILSLSGPPFGEWVDLEERTDRPLRTYEFEIGEALAWRDWMAGVAIDF